MADQEIKEVGTKCTTCNKPIKRRKRYYRNGSYYCNKNCWKSKTSTAEPQ